MVRIVYCPDCEQFGVGCDPADDSYEQDCEDFKPVVQASEPAETEVFAE